MKFRSGGHRLGLHRVVEPKGSLPQAAWKLDPSLPPYDNELLATVTALQIDAASFESLKKSDRPIAESVMKIVGERGKMHNPKTDSGGVFLGKVLAIGQSHPLAKKLHVGDPIVSLVSLSLTPLILNKINHVEINRDQLGVCGKAILFETGLLAKIPRDISEPVVLAALDVCGAPAQAKRLVKKKNRVLMIGLGKAGRSAASLLNRMGIPVFGIDPHQETIVWCQNNLQGSFRAFNANDPLSVYQWIKQETKGHMADLVIHATPVENTEMSAILSCRKGGRVLFFGMQTSFQRAVLGAEGIGHDVNLLMGSGYVPGHAELMFDLLQKHTALRKWFEKKFA